MEESDFESPIQSSDVCSHGMSRRSFLGSTAALLLSGSMAVANAKQPGREERKQNFIVILCDDLGYGDWGKIAKGHINTPHLQRMAAEGTVFTKFYAGASVCTPSRAALLTGAYPIRSGMAAGVIQVKDSHKLPTSVETIPKVLGSGYRSALVGKWHLGHSGSAWAPTNYGFDYYFGIPYSHDMSPLKLFESTGPDDLLEHPMEISMLQQRFIEKAESFIEKNSDKPFFLELALSSPHLPCYPPQQYKGKSQSGLYGDVVQELDDIVGRLLAKLKKLDLAKDTLVIFTSDNGPWFEGSTGGLRDRKGGDAFEGAYRVPMIAWQPGVVPAGKLNESIGSSMDFLPTFAAMAGVGLPKGKKFDGIDISEAILKGKQTLHDEIVLFSDEDVVGIRTQKWKMIRAAHYNANNPILDKMGYPQIYDMARDERESYSVASMRPDVLKEMQGRMDRAKAEFEPLRTKPSRLFNPPNTKQD